jgi:hypothetical protein
LLYLPREYQVRVQKLRTSRNASTRKSRLHHRDTDWPQILKIKKKSYSATIERLQANVGKQTLIFVPRKRMNKRFKFVLLKLKFGAFFRSCILFSSDITNLKYLASALNERKENWWHTTGPYDGQFAQKLDPVSFLLF